MCIYDASWQNQFGFCCDIDEESSQELARKFTVFPSFLCLLEVKVVGGNRKLGRILMQQPNFHMT